MMKTDNIKAHMSVVGSDNVQVGMVDHVEGEKAIKLTKDTKGTHHFITIDWVKSVDDKIHLDRTCTQAMDGWKDRMSMS